MSDFKWGPPSVFRDSKSGRHSPIWEHQRGGPVRPARPSSALPLHTPSFHHTLYSRSQMSHVGRSLKNAKNLFDTLSGDKPHVRLLLTLAAHSLSGPPPPSRPSTDQLLPSCLQSSVTDWIEILTGDNYALDELDGVAELVEAVSVPSRSPSLLVPFPRHLVLFPCRRPSSIHPVFL